MTATLKQLGNGALSTVLTTTLYTSPALTPSAIIREVIVANTNTTTARAVTIAVAGRHIMTAEPVPPNSKAVLALSTVMRTGDLITGGQDVGADCDYLLSGVEFS